MSDGIVTRAKGGLAERQVHIDDVQIPDLWHVAMYLKEHDMALQTAMVLETWYLAHDLKKHIQKEVR